MTLRTFCQNRQFVLSPGTAYNASKNGLFGTLIRGLKGSFKMTQNYQTATHNAWGTPQKWVRSDLPGIDRFLGVPQLAPFPKLLQDAELDPKGSKNLQKPLKFGHFWSFLRFWGQNLPIFSRFCC